MQFMVLGRQRTEQITHAAFQQVLPKETARVRQLYADGVIRQVWLSDDLPGACLIIEATDIEQARNLVDALPLARSGLTGFTVISLRPYPGFGPRATDD